MQVKSREKNKNTNMVRGGLGYYTDICILLQYNNPFHFNKYHIVFVGKNIKTGREVAFRDVDLPKSKLVRTPTTTVVNTEVAQYHK